MAKYVVVESYGGALRTLGPFSEHRALIAADALRRHSEAQISVHELLPSSWLDSQLPDWKRDVRV